MPPDVQDVLDRAFRSAFMAGAASAATIGRDAPPAETAATLEAVLTACRAWGVRELGAVAAVAGDRLAAEESV